MKNSPNWQGFSHYSVHCLLYVHDQHTSPSTNIFNVFFYKFVVNFESLRS